MLRGLALAVIIIAAFCVGYFLPHPSSHPSGNGISPNFPGEGVPIGVGGKDQVKIGHATLDPAIPRFVSWPCGPTSSSCTMNLEFNSNLGGSAQAYDCTGQKSCIDFTDTSFPVTFKYGTQSITKNVNVAGMIQITSP